MTKISYAGYRFPPVIIQQAIWLYVRFKPVALVADAIRDCSKRGGIVLDAVNCLREARCDSLRSSDSEGTDGQMHQRPGPVVENSATMGNTPRATSAHPDGVAVVALAVTFHPDFDDGAHGVKNSAVWHTHWVVLAKDAACQGGLRCSSPHYPCRRLRRRYNLLCNRALPGLRRSMTGVFAMIESIWFWTHHTPLMPYVYLCLVLVAWWAFCGLIILIWAGLKTIDMRDLLYRISVLTRAAAGLRA
jgi:hypothetical protein